MAKILDRDFFERDSVTVAKELLGCFLVRKTEEGIIKGKIVETEAYGDANDLASHARFGITNRNKIMYGPAGILYIYHIYGIFYLSNIICETEGKPSAVLIRSAEITDRQDLAIKNLQRSKFVKINEKIATGPGKLSLAFNLDKEKNMLDITRSEEIFIEEKQEKFDIIETRRIGIDYAEHCKNYPWRFYIKGSQYISKR